MSEEEHKKTLSIPCSVCREPREGLLFGGQLQKTEATDCVSDECFPRETLGPKTILWIPAMSVISTCG